MINWRAVPGLRLLLPFSVGILSAVVSSISLIWIGLASICLYIALFLWGKQDQIPYSRRWWYGVLLHPLMFGLGYWAVLEHDEFLGKNHYATFLQTQEDDELIVQIDELPTKAKRVKVIGKVLQSNNQQSDGHILLYLDSDEYSLRLDYGDIIAVRARPRSIAPPQNPYAFDFQNYMKLRNVRFSALVGKEQAQTLAQRRGNPIMHWAYDAQEALIAILAAHLEDENDVFSVGSALILGSRSDITEETLHAYINTGAMHVLSVSGLHVGLVATLFSWFIRKIRGRQKFWKTLSPILQLLFIWAFALITGATSCVLRAAVMFSFVIVGKAWSKDSNVYNLLAVSAFFLLIYNPYFFFDVSFQLSYIGLLGIVFFQPYIYRFGASNVFVFREFYLGNKLWELTSVSIAAMITTTPISLYYFHQFPTYFWLSGLIVVPLATVALYAGLALFAISWWTGLAFWVGKILSWTIWIMNKSLFYIEQIPPGVVRDIWVNVWGSAFWYIAVFYFATALAKKQLKWTKYSLVALLLIVLQYNYLEIKSNQQNLMVIYNAGKDVLLDIFEGEKVYSIHNQDISSRTIDFSGYNNRLKHRSKSAEINSLVISDSLQIANLRIENGVCQYKGKTIFLLDNFDKINDLVEPIKVDYLLIHNSPFLDFDLLSQKIKVEKIIFTAGNKVGSLKFYKSQCEQRQIAYHDVKENGAFVVDFKQNKQN